MRWKRKKGGEACQKTSNRNGLCTVSEGLKQSVCIDGQEEDGVKSRMQRYLTRSAYCALSLEVG